MELLHFRELIFIVFFLFLFFEDIKNVFLVLFFLELFHEKFEFLRVKREICFDFNDFDNQLPYLVINIHFLGDSESEPKHILQMEELDLLYELDDEETPEVEITESMFVEGDEVCRELQLTGIFYAFKDVVRPFVILL